MNPRSRTENSSSYGCAELCVEQTSRRSRQDVVRYFSEIISKMHCSVLTSFGPISRYNTFCVLNQCSPRKYNLPEKADLNFFRNTMIMLRCCSEHYLTKKIMLHRKRKDHAPPETWSDDFPMLSNCKPTHNSHIRK